MDKGMTNIKNDLLKTVKKMMETGFRLSISTCTIFLGGNSRTNILYLETNE